MGEKSDSTDKFIKGRREYIYGIAQSENLLNILESMQVGVIIINDETHNITYINHYASETLNSAPEMIIGRNCHEFICPSETGNCPVTDQKNGYQLIEDKLLRPDGSFCRILKSINHITFQGKSSLIETFTDITELKQIQEEAVKLNDRLEGIIKGIADWVWETDSNGLYTYCSESVEKIIGYKAEELIGNQFTIFLAPEEIKQASDKSRQIVETEKPFRELENWAIHKDGSRVCLITSGTPKFHNDGSFAGYRGVNSDITVRKTAEKELIRIKAAIDISSNAIGILSADGNQVYQNKTYTRMFGYEFEEFETVHPFSLYADIKEAENLFKEVSAGGKYDKEIEMVTKEGDRFPAHVRVDSVKNEKGNVMALICVYMDITGRKAREKRDTLLNTLQSRLLKPDLLDTKLKQITDAVIPAIDADFARIWFLKPGDICKQGCIHYKSNHYEKYCVNKLQCLHLLASSGRYTHVNGDHRRIPENYYEIGSFFTLPASSFLIPDVSSNPKIKDKKWANELGLVSFAGYKLTNSDGKYIGVLAVFSKNEITAEVKAFLESVANIASQVIGNAATIIDLEEALLESERANTLMAGREIRIRQMKKMINSLSLKLGNDWEYNAEDTLEIPAPGAEIDLLEAKKNALSLAEDAEIARRQAVEVSEQLSTIKQAVNSSSDAIAVSTITGDFIYINNTFSKLFNYTITELAVLPEETLYKENINYSKSILSLSKGEHYLKEVEMISKDGRIIPVYMRSVPFMDDKGIITGLVWNFTDISKQRKDQEKIQEYTLTIENDLVEKKAMLQKAVFLQKSYIQTTLPVLENFNIHALFMPCEQLGGDFFHIIKGIHENKLIIIIGDCTDHGIKASMDASLLSSVVKKNLSLLYTGNRTDLFLNKVNNNYMEFADEDQFPTIFAAIIDLDTKEMFYSNANSETPIVIRKNRIEPLEKAAGMHIGYFDDPEYERKCFRFTPGDRLLFYSDAIIEIKKENQERLEYSGLKKILNKKTGNAESSFKDLLDQLEKKNGRLPLDDDTTLIQIDFAEICKKEYRFHNLAEWHVYQNTIKNILFEFDYTSDEIEKTGISLNEMCINAFNHGNKMDETKIVIVKVIINCRGAVFTITDEGSGFNPELVPDPVANIEEIMERDDEDEFTHGRGIWITRRFVKSINYSKKGNSVLISIEKNQRVPL